MLVWSYKNFTYLHYLTNNFPDLKLVYITIHISLFTI